MPTEEQVVAAIRRALHLRRRGRALTVKTLKELLKEPIKVPS